MPGLINRIFENKGHTYGPEDEGGQGVNPETGLTAHETKQRLFQIKQQQDAEAAAAEKQRQKLAAEAEAAKERDLSRQMQMDEYRRQRAQEQANIAEAADKEAAMKERHRKWEEDEKYKRELMGKVTGPTWHGGPTPNSPFEVPAPQGGWIMPPVASQGVIDDLRKVRANLGTVVSAEDLQQWKARQMEDAQQNAQEQEKARIKGQEDAVKRLQKAFEGVQRRSLRSSTIDSARRAAVDAAQKAQDAAYVAGMDEPQRPTFEYEGPQGTTVWHEDQGTSNIQNKDQRKEAEDYIKAHRAWVQKKELAERAAKRAKDAIPEAVMNADVDSLINNIQISPESASVEQDMEDVLDAAIRYGGEKGARYRDLESIFDALEVIDPAAAERVKARRKQKQSSNESWYGDGAGTDEGSLSTQYRPTQEASPTVQSGGYTDPDSPTSMSIRRQQIQDQLDQYDRDKKDAPKQLVQEAAALERKIEKTTGKRWRDNSALIERRKYLEGRAQSFIKQGLNIPQNIYDEMVELDKKLPGYDVYFNATKRGTGSREFLKRKK